MNMAIESSMSPAPEKASNWRAASPPYSLAAIMRCSIIVQPAAAAAADDASKHEMDGGGGGKPLARVRAHGSSRFP